MENSEKIKIIQYHNNLNGMDCPCVLRATGKIEVNDQSRMPVDEEELGQWKIRMIADIESKEYLIKRVYPPTGDQFDYIYHNGVEVWKAWIKETIKDKWPKPG